MSSKTVIRTFDNLTSSAARFGNLSPFGLLFEPFGNQYFALATWQFGYFLGYFWKIVKRTYAIWYKSKDLYANLVNFEVYLKVPVS